ncbi:MAG: twin-arginine translocation signal domain-containing protein [Kiritimatiellae bacterium]|nr:twin-arginine translocation signal domain-containing protein [Kiritimatiellia bacterium]MDD3583564.1 twin-arginine translocation signal domain-containing protein [Kiritimatiellia bacterium]
MNMTRRGFMGATAAAGAGFMAAPVLSQQRTLDSNGAR